MSVRLRNPDAPADATANVSVLQLENLTARAEMLGLVFEVDHGASAGSSFRILGATTRELARQSGDIEAVVLHLGAAATLNDTLADLPQGPSGTVDPTTQPFKNRRSALRLKTGYSGLDCDKALRWADGDAEKALAKLIDTNGYAHYKV